MRHERSGEKPKEAPLEGAAAGVWPSQALSSFDREARPGARLRGAAIIRRANSFTWPFPTPLRRWPVQHAARQIGRLGVGGLDSFPIRTGRIPKGPFGGAQILGVRASIALLLTAKVRRQLHGDNDRFGAAKVFPAA